MPLPKHNHHVNPIDGVIHVERNFLTSMDDSTSRSRSQIQGYTIQSDVVALYFNILLVQILKYAMAAHVLGITKTEAFS